MDSSYYKREKEAAAELCSVAEPEKVLRPSGIHPTLLRALQHPKYSTEHSRDFFIFDLFCCTDR